MKFDIKRRSCQSKDLDCGCIVPTFITRDHLSTDIQSGTKLGLRKAHGFARIPELASEIEFPAHANLCCQPRHENDGNALKLCVDGDWDVNYHLHGAALSVNKSCQQISCELREGNYIQSCLKVPCSDKGSGGVESSVNSNREALIAKINRKDWWHVTPGDPRAYDKRGKFYASTFREGEFWGRPLDTPERITIRNPVIGDEPEVWRVLFGKPVKSPGINDRRILEWRWNLDARMKTVALKKGYDAIVILSAIGFKKYVAGKLPRSIELNVLNPTGA